MSNRIDDLFYVVSVIHTHRPNLYITLWCPNNTGYCLALSNAGQYERERVMEKLDNYNGGDSVAVPCSVLDSIAVPPVPGLLDNDAGPCVPNTRASWKLILANVIVPSKYPACPEFKGARRKHHA